MNIYAYILVGLYTLALGMTIADHGKPQKPNNAYGAIIGYIIIMVLLFLGGFFR